MRPITYKASCPFSNRPQEVYVYPLFHDGKLTLEFNGCDSFYHSCEECETACKAKALQFASQVLDEDGPLHAPLL
jgi:ferredoxin